MRGGIGYFYVPIQASAYNPYANIAPFAPTFTFNDVAFADPYGTVNVANPFPSQYGPDVPGADVAFTVPATLRAVFQRDLSLPLLTSWNFLSKATRETGLFARRTSATKVPISSPPRKTDVS